MKVNAFIIDKAFVSRRVLERILLDYVTNGDSVEITGEAGSVSEAVYLLEDAAPDVVFIYLEPEEMRFIASDIAEIKKQNSAMIVVFCATSKNPETAEPAWRNGADNFLVKPYKTEKVHSIIKSIISSRA